MNKLERQIIDISYENKLSHISSCLGSVNFIDHCYEVMKDDDIFVLGNSHASLAHYVVLEKYGKANARELVKKHGVHANRDVENGIHVSGGSLGQAETVAVGMALANRDRDVYLLTSDGACNEGAIWEALRIAADNRLENLKVAVIANGMGALGKIDTDYLDTRLNAFYPVLVVRTNMFAYPDWLNGFSGHYAVMDEEKYKEVTE